MSSLAAAVHLLRSQVAALRRCRTKIRNYSVWGDDRDSAESLNPNCAEDGEVQWCFIGSEEAEKRWKKLETSGGMSQWDLSKERCQIL